MALRYISRALALMLLGTVLVGCGQPPTVHSWGKAKDPISVRSEIHSAKKLLYYVADHGAMARIKRVHLGETLLTCFPTTPKDRPDAPEQFLELLGQRLGEQLIQKRVFQLVELGQPADAEMRIEIVALHNGKKAVDPFTSVLLSLVLIQPEIDPGLARCDVMFCRPGTDEVVAALTCMVSASTFGADRTETLAKLLASEITSQSQKFKKVDAKSLSKAEIKRIGRQ